MGEKSGGVGINKEDGAEQQRTLGVSLRFLLGKGVINVMEAKLLITFSVKQKSMALILLRGKSLTAFKLYFRKNNLETLMSTDSHGERRYGD